MCANTKPTEQHHLNSKSLPRSAGLRAIGRSLLKFAITCFGRRAPFKSTVVCFAYFPSRLTIGLPAWPRQFTFVYDRGIHG